MSQQEKEEIIAMAPNSFPQFALLPAEIQLQIWESTAATLPDTLKMHLFDVHAPVPQPLPPPSPIRQLRPRSKFHKLTHTHRRRHRRVRQTVSYTKSPHTQLLEQGPLVTIRTSSQRANTTSSSDPSLYKFRSALRATCTDAARTVHRFEASIPPENRTAIVDTSSRAQTSHPIVLDAAHDVLYLRFLVDTPPAATKSAPLPPPLTAIFQSLWSDSLAAALYGARRVALDVSQIWPQLVDEALAGRLVHDVAFLACTLQNELEALYLVVEDSSSSLRARELQTKGELYRRLQGVEDRDPDVIHGVGKAWREVFDLEGLGWHERCPGFAFAEMFGEAVRLQQGNWYGDGERKATFQGVRVLIAEDE